MIRIASYFAKRARRKQRILPSRKVTESSWLLLEDIIRTHWSICFSWLSSIPNSPLSFSELRWNILRMNFQSYIKELHPDLESKNSQMQLGGFFFPLFLQPQFFEMATVVLGYLKIQVIIFNYFNISVDFRERLFLFFLNIFFAF